MDGPAGVGATRGTPEFRRATRSSRGGPTLGVLALFSREEMDPQSFRVVATVRRSGGGGDYQFAVFESLERAKAELAKHANELRQVIDIAPQHMFIWEPDGNLSYGKPRGGGILWGLFLRWRRSSFCS